MNSFPMFKLLFVIIFLLNVESTPDFCRGNARIDAITRLSNGSLFLTSDHFYWTLNKNSEGFYENPTQTNARNISSLFSGIERIDSIESFTSHIGLNGQTCGNETETLMVYWFDHRVNDANIRFYIDWKEVQYFKLIKLTQAITANTTQIDWKYPINATLYYKISNQSYYEIYQRGKCSKRRCDENWHNPSNCTHFELDSIYCESSAPNQNQIVVYGFSGKYFSECRGDKVPYFTDDKTHL